MTDSPFKREPLCPGGCGNNEHWCVCPPRPPPPPPAWRTSYPPLHCMICGATMDVLPALKAMAPQMTCGPDCREEFERRYYQGTILERPYTPRKA